MDYTTRYQSLNPGQRAAVDQIDGPVMVIAGPGTGKTELLSMRVASILKRTDVLPKNILCLTFTESGAEAMRTRLAGIVGPGAYEVAIHTFHSFGSETIANNREYFYRGAEFRPADDITSLEILTKIFDELDYANPLSSKMNDEYTYLSDAKRTISELKRSGLTSDELLKIIDAGDAVLDAVEPDLQQIFSDRVSLKMMPALTDLAQKAAALPVTDLPRGSTPLSNIFAISLAHAIDEAEALNSTKPITAWKSNWCEKDTRGMTVCKNRKRHERLRQMSHVYYRYLVELERAGLYDFDDMILNVIHGMETQADLKANLQETYQYILVDEFQDTNLAQTRLLLNLIDNPVNEGVPNIMTVGDDDQAIYSFQGAEVGNMMQFLQEFPDTKKIVLTENYRSTSDILALSRDVINLGENRLENFDDDIDKTLHANRSSSDSIVEVLETTTKDQEYAQVADAIAADIAAGTPPESIAVLARKHAELEAIVPYLAQQSIAADYERQNNLFDLDVVRTLTLTGEIIRELSLGHLGHVDTLLPEFLSHPALDIDAVVIWKLSLKAYSEMRSWSELLAVTPELSELHAWLIESATRYAHTPCEPMIDHILGTSQQSASPLHSYYFGDNLRFDHPERLLETIHALSELRTKLQAHLDAMGETESSFNDLLEFIELYQKYNQKIAISRPSAGASAGLVQLMTAHKAKGLEFAHVYVLNADDRTWGAKARSRSSKISYPDNLPLAPHTGSRDEQIRLLFVALTRAKTALHICYAASDANSRPQSISDLLLVEHTPSPTERSPSTNEDLLAETTRAWQSHLIAIPETDLKTLLAPMLTRYKLSATHINNFIDLKRGGPHYFMLQNLLHVPQSFSPHAAFGTAIHKALQLAQTHLVATKKQKPLEDTLQDFETVFATFPFDETVKNFFAEKGSDVLQKFLASEYTGFDASSKAEFDFAHQNVIVNSARLTGKIDLAAIDTDQKELRVIDYKTGKPALSWQGKSDDDKIKLHKYRQQLMFYQLLAEHSRQFSEYTWISGALQFVEPDVSGVIAPPLVAAYSEDEYRTFQKLVAAVWHCIQTLELPDASDFSDSYKGILEFEAYLIDKYGNI